MGQNLQYKIGSYGTFDPQDFCKFCSQKHLEEILLVGSNISSRNLMETGAFFVILIKYITVYRLKGHWF